MASYHMRLGILDTIKQLSNGLLDDTQSVVDYKYDIFTFMNMIYYESKNTYPLENIYLSDGSIGTEMYYFYYRTGLSEKYVLALNQM